MFKIILYFIILAALVGGAVGAWHLTRVALRNKKEMAPFTGTPVAYQNDLGRVLVVYYSLSGHTRDIAEKIAHKTNADIYEIQTAEKLPAAPMLYFAVKKQLKNADYPAVSPIMPDFKAYDTIFVGSPIWWYTAATPVYAFLKQADFAGKNVVPFSTQGSNVSSYFEDFKAMAKNGHILKGESFNNLPRKYDQAVDNKINVWLNSLPKN